MGVPMGPPPPPQNPNSKPNPNPHLDPDVNPNPSSLIQIVEEHGGIESRVGSQEDAMASDPTPEPNEESPENPNPNPSSTPEHQRVPVPYTIPQWSEPPSHPFLLEVLKDGAIIEQLDVSNKGSYMFGRLDLCDFVLEHPTISRFHAVLQFKKDAAFLFDLDSTHGTFINKNQVKKKMFTDVHVGDVIRFGQSSRLYIFQGPSELMPPEGNLNRLRIGKVHEDMLDREASLLRARVEASLADGVSWGISEDAIEEATEDDADEVTWQTYKGLFTERQDKLRSKIIKRMEKVANMKKEIDAIRAKDISQGGLTQGQQTQIARNEQRISQIMEELESLEETLNDSIEESTGARGRKDVRGRKKEKVEDEDEILSEEDDFYDRTNMKNSKRKAGEQQLVETADTLLDKKEAIVNEMEGQKALLLIEESKLAHSTDNCSEAGDDLDAFMTGLSSQLVVDKTTRIQKELSGLKAELDKVMYLLKIADPMGEAARRREVKVQIPNTTHPVSDITERPPAKQKPITKPEKPVITSKPVEAPHPTRAENCADEVTVASEDREKKNPSYTFMKPQWLGDTKRKDLEGEGNQEAHLDSGEPDDFVDYKDRKKVLVSVENGKEPEAVTSGLIIRKRKPVDEPGTMADKHSKVVASTPADAETAAAAAVALLLKHKRGLSALDEEESIENQSGKDNPQPKRVIGPSRPPLFNKSPDYESWVPPEGQTGDGRTSLNDRLGY